jgi:hypothetical protein
MRQHRIPRGDAFRCSVMASRAPKLRAGSRGRFSSLVAGRQHVFEREGGIFLPPPKRARASGSKRRDQGCPQIPARRVFNDPPSGPVDNLSQGRLIRHIALGGKEAKAQRLQ